MTYAATYPSTYTENRADSYYSSFLSQDRPELDSPVFLRAYKRPHSLYRASKENLPRAAISVKMATPEQPSFLVRSRDQEHNADPFDSSCSQRDEPNRLLMATSGLCQPSLRLSKAIAVSPEPCHTCEDLHRKIQYIAYGIDGLLLGVRDAAWAEHIQPQIDQEIENRKRRLEPVIITSYQLVTWILETIEATARILSQAKTDYPRRTGESHHREKITQASYVATGAKRKLSFPGGEREPLSLPSMSYRSDSKSHEGSSNYISDEDWNRKLSDGSLASHFINSASENVLMPSTLTPQMSPESRILPLPPSNSSLPSLSPQLSTASAAHVAHLQDLQNQVGSRILAYEILQREHQSLLSAFEISQTRIAALDKKSLATNTEIRDLHDGRIKLEAQIDSLEAQVGEIQQNRDDAQDQSIAKDAQYMHIMAMSTKLEAQGAYDSQKWKAERKKWELERKAFTRQITALEIEKSALLLKLDGTGPPESARTCSHRSSEIETVDDLGNSTSHQVLRQEVEELRMNCQKMQSVLEVLYQESTHFDEVFERLGGISKRLQRHLRTTHNQTSSPFNSEILDLNGGD